MFYYQYSPFSSQQCFFASHKIRASGVCQCGNREMPAELDFQDNPF